MSKLINGNLWLETTDISSRLEYMDKVRADEDILIGSPIVPTGYQMVVYSFYEEMKESGRLITFYGADVSKPIICSYYVGDDRCVGDDFVFIKVLEFSKPERSLVATCGDKSKKYYELLNRIMVIDYKNKPEEVK